MYMYLADDCCKGANLGHQLSSLEYKLFDEVNEAEAGCRQCYDSPLVGGNSSQPGDYIPGVKAEPRQERAATPQPRPSHTLRLSDR